MSSDDRDDLPTSAETSWPQPQRPTGDQLDIELAAVGSRIADRFVVHDFLGAGAHGAVYEVHDEHHDRRLALKTLLRLSPEELVRFKHEFRVVSDLAHPNLVAVHELFVRGPRAWLTMELCPGTDFLSWVREDDAFDAARLRDALHQLARGLSALHAAGILHRDLKPSNVLVRPDGHVLVADFGLARELDRDREEGIAGTPAYMSPEQAADLELDAASDWYGVGVMLYEALTGKRPHAGLEGVSLLMAKQAGHPGAPSLVVDGVPADLDELCSDLLSRLPGDRPNGAQVLARLGAPAGAAPSSDVFVGRGRELLVLERALEQLRTTANAKVIVVEGRSGAGKSALVRRWLHDASASGAIVLTGRCYERESVPYKGLDELVDRLRAHLHDHGGAAPIAGAGALGRLFPVLRDVPGIGDAPVSRDDDPFASRRQAVDALRELLDRVARTGPLVLVIDDLQWCDDDSAGLLLELLRSRHRPRALFVALVRTDDGETPAPLARVADGLAQVSAELDLERIAIGPLPLSESIAIARALLPGREELADAIAAECDGNPLLAAELARNAAPLAHGLQLDEVIRARAARLPAHARAVLEVVAIAGGPTAQRAVIEAAHAHAQGLESIALLRAHAFVRGHGASAIEPYHDRIAVGVRATMTAAQIAECHRALAEALERGGGEPEEIAFHFEAAGEAARALDHVTRAAERAADALA
ncbi:MAG TPA: serine/threonine-protein kinase, partial [Nannocystaceae bacterium]|nr:serine/threonine-protein kinase [Nannocystaceae bacterium]